MNANKEIFTKSGVFMAAALLATSLVPYAHATSVEIGFNGAGSSGHASLMVGPDTTAGDPAGAQVITGATGTFSDTNIGLGNVSITGVLARNFATPADTVPSPANDPLPFPPVPFPASYSALIVPQPPPGDKWITYDELFYANGSPRTCWDYPFAGGIFDDYGVMFTLGNGGFVDLWSDGITAPAAFGPTWPGGLTYGFAVIDNTLTVTDFQFTGANAAVPEPNFPWLFGAGIFGLLAWRRTLESRRTSRGH